MAASWAEPRRRPRHWSDCIPPALCAARFWAFGGQANDIPYNPKSRVREKSYRVGCLILHSGPQPANPDCRTVFHWPFMRMKLRLAMLCLDMPGKTPVSSTLTRLSAVPAFSSNRGGVGDGKVVVGEGSRKKLHTIQTNPAKYLRPGSR